MRRLFLLPLILALSGCLNHGTSLAPTQPTPSSPPPTINKGDSPRPNGAAMLPSSQPTPSATEPHSHVQLPDGRGEAYVLADTVYLRTPGEEPRALYQMADGTSLVHVAADLSYLLLHERLPAVLHVAEPAPTPTKTKPHGGSRLVKQPLGAGDRQVLIERFYDYDLTLSMAPDQRTAAVITRLAPDMGGKRPLHLLDVETGALTPVAPDHWIIGATWSPDGTRLAAYGRRGGQPPDYLYLVEKDQPTLKEIHPLPSGAPPVWLPDNATLFGTSPKAKYEGVARLSFYPIDGSAPREATIDVSGGDDPATVRLVDYHPSPDGSRVVARRMVGTEMRRILIDVSAGTWSYFRPYGDFVRWSPDGSEPLCDTPDPNALTPCSIERKL